MERVKMDLIRKLLPTLWQILDKNKKCAINVATIDGKLTVSILFGKRKKVFSHHHDDILIDQLQQFTI